MYVFAISQMNDCQINTLSILVEGNKTMQKQKKLRILMQFHNLTLILVFILNFLFLRFFSKAKENKQLTLSHFAPIISSFFHWTKNVSKCSKIIHCPKKSILQNYVT